MNQMQHCFYSEEQHASLLQDESFPEWISAGKPGHVVSFLLGGPPSFRSPELRAPALPPLPGQALGLHRAGMPHNRTQTLVCNIRNVHAAHSLADGSAASC